jgi:hypothetical protein
MEAVPIDNLNHYLVTAEKEAAQNDGDAKLRFELDVEEWKANNTIALEMFKSVTEAGLNAIKAAMAINGAACIALLAFLGNLITNGHTENNLVSELGYALFVFVCCAGFAGTGSGTRYISQALFSEALENDRKNEKSCWRGVGYFFQVVSVLLGAMAFIGFFYGGWLSYQAIIAQ